MDSINIHGNDIDDTVRVKTLYEALLRQKGSFSQSEIEKLFISEAEFICLDGSRIKGRDQIMSRLNRELLNLWISPVRLNAEVTFLSSTLAILHAGSGIPNLNKSMFKSGLHLLLTTKQDGEFRIAVFQMFSTVICDKQQLSIFFFSN